MRNSRILEAHESSLESIRRYSPRCVLHSQEIASELYCVFVVFFLPKDTSVQVGVEFPAIPERDAPTVAIVTTLFCEKMAVDEIMEKRTTFIRHNAECTVSGRFKCE